uniref:JAZF zinc finger 1 n=1 Tax=Equus asinus TaxID=9793 RepID=A0A9L0J1A2_EQUAS
DKVGGRRSQVRPRSRSGGWGRTAVAARPGPSSQLRRPQPPPPPSPRRSRRRHRRCRLPSASRSLLALLASLSPPLPPSRPLRSPHPASLPLPQPLLSSPHPASLPPPARSSQSRHQGGSRCSTMTGIAAASFFSNTCRFGGCGLHFPTLADLIEHIEDNHIENGTQKERADYSKLQSQAEDKPHSSGTSFSENSKERGCCFL